MTTPKHAPSAIVHVLLAGVLAAACDQATATTAIGTENALGNAMNPSGTDPGCVPDLGGLNPTRRGPTPRSLTGWQYAQPCAEDDTGGEHRAGGDETGGWLFTSKIELGYVFSSGDDDGRYFAEYADWDDGPTVSYLDVRGQDRRTADFVELLGGSLGRDDQFVSLGAGRRGSFAVNAHYQEIPHLTGVDARSPYSGIGGSVLTLPAALPPGLNDSATVMRSLDFAQVFDLSLERKRSGFDLQWTPSANLKLFADYDYEDRSGTKAFSGSGFFNYFIPGGFGTVLELPAPVDYGTHSVSMGTQLRGNLWALNLIYTGSFFHNENESLTWENPFFSPSLLPPATGTYVPTTMRQALEPDNSAHNVKAEFSLNFLGSGTWVSTVALGWMLQDDSLLPYTVSSGLGGTLVAPIDYGDWNTLAALPRNSADAEIQTALVESNVGYNLLENLRLRAGIRHYDEDNESTPFETYNAVTGQYGYVVMDGSLGSIIPGENIVFAPGVPGSYFHYRSIPFERDETKITVGADWTLDAMTLAAEYEFKKIDRKYREVDTTDENRLRLIGTVRSWARTSLRLLGEYAERRFDGNYDSYPYGRFYTSHLPGFVPLLPAGQPPHTLASLYKFDLSDRDETVLESRLNLLLTDRIDGYLSARYKKDDFDARHGLRDDRTFAFNGELSYSPGRNGSIFVFGSWQDRELEQANIADRIFNADVDPSPGSITYPWENEWFAHQDEESAVFGAGYTRMLGPTTLKLNYSWSDTTTAIDSKYASEGALVQTVVNLGVAYPVQAGQNRFPDIKYRRQIFETDLLVPIAKAWEARFYYRYDSGKIKDWHYTGLGASPVPLDTRILTLGLEPEGWAAHVLGMFLRFSY